MNDRELALVPYYDKTLDYYSPICTEALNLFEIEWPDVRNVLDLGCGDGRLAEFVPAETRIFGVDGSPGRIAAAVAKWPRHRWHVADLYDPLPVGEGPADQWPLICLFEVLEHLASPLSVLSAAIGALKPSGRVIGSVPILDGPSERHLQMYATDDNARERLLEPVWSEPFGRHLLMEWRAGDG